jgi:calcineurin-like phosphoesterase family protein
MKELFAADLHLGHANVSKFRKQFSSPEEHDSVIYENIMRQLCKRTTLYLLGDVCLSVGSLKYIQGFRSITDRVILIGGNHCTDNIRMNQLVETYSEIHFYKNKYGFTLSHMPIHADHLRNRLNVHGHLHDLTIDDPRYINVSLEQIDFRPISLQTIREIFYQRILTNRLDKSYLPSLKIT